MLPITDQMRSSVATLARAQVGKQYVLNTAGPTTFDCSGLTRYAWAHVGIDLPHNSVLQAQVMDSPYVTLVPYVEANIRKMRLGDLLFYYPADWHHVAIYTDIAQPGGWLMMTQATDPDLGVQHLRLAQYAPPVAIGFMGHQ